RDPHRRAHRGADDERQGDPREERVLPAERGLMGEGSDPMVTVVESTSRRSKPGPAPSGRRCLVGIGEGLDATYPLPDSGKVDIGRAPDSEIRIDHPSVSRTHARLTIGATLVIEDRGSANGTRIRDRWLQSGASSEVALGEPIDVGTVMVVVQQRSVQ